MPDRDVETIPPTTTFEGRPFDLAPHFALNGGASDFAKATPDKSQGKQDRFV